MRRTSLAVVVPLMAACVTASGLGAPELDVGRLHRPQLDLIPPEVRLDVTDLRSPLPESSPAAVADVRRALRRLLERQQLRVHDAAVHRLDVAFAFVNAPPRGFDREDCIAVALKLEIARNVGMAYSSGYACYGARNLYGMRTAGDPTTTYEQALNSALQQLEAYRRQLPPSAAPRPRASARLDRRQKLDERVGTF